MIKDLWPFIAIQIAIVFMTGLLITGTNLWRSSVILYDENSAISADISGINNEFLENFYVLNTEDDISFDNYYQVIDENIYDLIYRQRYQYVLSILKTNYILLSNNDVRCNQLLYYMGYMYFEMKKYSHAIENWLELLNKTPNDFHVLNSLGTAYFSLKDYQNAKNNLEKAYDLQSNNLLIIKNLLSVYKKLKMKNEIFFLEFRLIELQDKELSSAS